MNYNENWMTERELSDLTLKIAIAQIEEDFEMLETQEIKNMLERFSLELETTVAQIAYRIMKVRNPFWTILLLMKTRDEFLHNLRLGVLFVKNRANEWEPVFVDRKTFTGDGKNQVYLPINEHMLKPILPPKWRLFDA